MSAIEYKYSFLINHGPTKIDLFHSLGDPTCKVEFILEGAQVPVIVFIKMLEQEDNSGESWKFKGWIKNYDQRFYIEGYYSSKHFAGDLIFMPIFYFKTTCGMTQGMERPEHRLMMDKFVDCLRDEARASGSQVVKSTNLSNLEDS